MSEQMKERTSKLSLIVFALLIALFSLVNTSIKTEIQRDVPLDIYDDGVIVSKTVAHIDGTRAHYWVGKEDNFAGRFAVEAAERTCSEHVSAHIVWKEDHLEHQTIMFFSGGDFLVNEFGVNHVLLINPEMTEMAIQMKDGRVLASSETVYEIYMQHFTYNADNGTTGIASGIPQF